LNVKMGDFVYYRSARFPRTDSVLAPIWVRHVEPALGHFVALSRVQSLCGNFRDTSLPLLLTFLTFRLCENFCFADGGAATCVAEYGDLGKTAIGSIPCQWRR
jgi:hypothetical protein